MTYEPKEHQILDEVVAVLHGHYGESLSQVVLFGSRARRDHEHEPESDFDILVVLKSEVDTVREMRKISDEIYDIVSRYGVVIFCMPVSEERFKTGASPLILNICKEGVSS